MDLQLQWTVENLLARYVHAIDDGQLEAWPEFFTDHGRYKVVTAENHERGLPLALIDADSRAMLRDRVSSLRNANVYERHRYRHVVSSTLVTAEATSALAVSCFQVTRIMHTGESMTFATGRYVDRIRVDGARALFEEKLVILDSRAIDTLLAIPL